MINKSKAVALFLFAGLVSGILSLIISAVASYFFSETSSYFSLYVLVVIEELVKFYVLLELAKNFLEGEIRSYWQIIVMGAFLGLGFGLFELELIYLTTNSIQVEAFAPVVVHIATSIILGCAAFLKLNTKRQLTALLVVVFAVLLHLCYNVVVLNSGY